MKAKIISILFICILIALPMSKADAITGTPDKVPAATLIVPLMESSAVGGPENTLIVVDYSCGFFSPTIHWELWDIDGNLTGIQGNVALGPFEDWVIDMAAIVAAATPSQAVQLLDGDFYRGFLTIDAVSASTTLSPTDDSYPILNYNCFTGDVYYVRLTEGAANGINMIHVEAASTSANVYQTGFYRSTDQREAFDADARYYSSRQTHGLATGADPNDLLDYTRSRVFLDPSLNGHSRIVLWTWCPVWCGSTTNISPSADSGGSFGYLRTDESGAVVENTTIDLNHVVNIIDVSGTENGTVIIQDIPQGFNIYGFVSNAAEGSAQETWEAMFETLIATEPNDVVTP